MVNPKVLETIEINESLWIDIIEVKRKGRIIGSTAIMCQGNKFTPTEFYISKFDIDPIIKSLKLIREKL